MGNRKLAQDSVKLQKSEDKHDQKPIWKYQKMLSRKIKQHDKHYVLNNTDGTQTSTKEERRQRWAEWTEQCFQQDPITQEPTVLHITEPIWKALAKSEHGNHHHIQMHLQQIRKNPPLQQLFAQYPETENVPPIRIICAKYRT